MHSQYDDVCGGRYFFRIPTLFWGQDSIFGELCSRRFKDFIIRSSDLMASLFQSNSQVVHDTSRDGDKMNPLLFLLHGTTIPVKVKENVRALKIPSCDPC